VGLATLHMDHKTHTARLVLEPRIIKPLRRRQPRRVGRSGPQPFLRRLFSAHSRCIPPAPSSTGMSPVFNTIYPHPQIVCSTARPSSGRSRLRGATAPESGAPSRGLTLPRLKRSSHPCSHASPAGGYHGPGPRGADSGAPAPSDPKNRNGPVHHENRLAEPSPGTAPAPPTRSDRECAPRSGLHLGRITGATAGAERQRRFPSDRIPDSHSGRTSEAESGEGG
jgi:hypothetical protein